MVFNIIVGIRIVPTDGALHLCSPFATHFRFDGKGMGRLTRMMPFLQGW